MEGMFLMLPDINFGYEKDQNQYEPISNSKFFWAFWHDSLLVFFISFISFIQFIHFIQFIAFILIRFLFKSNFWISN